MIIALALVAATSTSSVVEEAPPVRRWYGWHTLLTDLSAGVLGGAGGALLASSDGGDVARNVGIGLITLGALSWIVPPIDHAMRGRTEAAVWSAVLRLVGTGLGAAILLIELDCDEEDCGYAPYIAGPTFVGVGALAAIITDASASRTSGRVEPIPLRSDHWRFYLRARPFIALGEGGGAIGELGFAYRFDRPISLSLDLPAFGAGKLEESTATPFAARAIVAWDTTHFALGLGGGVMLIRLADPELNSRDEITSVAPTASATFRAGRTNGVTLRIAADVVFTDLRREASTVCNNGVCNDNPTHESGVSPSLGNLDGELLVPIFETTDFIVGGGLSQRTGRAYGEGGLRFRTDDVWFSITAGAMWVQASACSRNNCGEEGAGPLVGLGVDWVR